MPKIVKKETKTPVFVTGSHAYGKPRPDSDVDLVMYCSKETSNKLWDLLGVPESWGNPSVDTSMRAGKLNIIYCLFIEEYEMWKKGTEELIAMRDRTGEPISREFARDYFADLRTKLNKAVRKPSTDNFDL